LCEGLEQHPEIDLPEKLKLHAAYYFGSLQKAKAALKTDRRVLAGWSKADELRVFLRLLPPLPKCTGRDSRSAMQQRDVLISGL
jgi:hypothetical protein